jgi:DNA primase small subunit
MNNRELNFVLAQFARYYSKAKIDVERIEQREFGVGIEKKIDVRHLAFSDINALRSYLISNTPLYISHSTAFYEHPDATPMQNKGWLGAELVFDLDVHTEKKYDIASLEKVKENVITLVEDFLLKDFGIDKNSVVVVFSGNRGYHVYVKDAAFFELGSDERREIANYVAGVGLNYKQFFNVEAITKNAVRITGPKPTEHGWRGRFARAAIKVLNNNPKKISPKFLKEEERINFISGINNGNWSKTSVPDIIEKMGVVAEELNTNRIITDAAVTHDITKLIRMPNSIHGGSGLIAKPVKRIDEFEPYRDALIECEPFTVEFIEDVPSIEFANSTYGPFKKGEKKELIGALALLFLLKESANVVFS